MGDRRHGGVASPPRANATIEVSRSDVEVETRLDVRSFVRASVDRATRSLARREPTRHPSHPSPLIHLFIHPSLHPFVAHTGTDALEGGHRRVVIGDSSKPYVSRMTTVVDVRNSDIDRFHRSSHRSIDRFHRSSHRSIDRFHRSHRSHRSHRIDRIDRIFRVPSSSTSSSVVSSRRRRRAVPCRRVRSRRA